MQKIFTLKRFKLCSANDGRNLVEGIFMPSDVLLLFLSEVKHREVKINEVRYLLKNYSLDKTSIVASEKVRGEIHGYRDELLVR